MNHNKSLRETQQVILQFLPLEEPPLDLLVRVPIPVLARNEMKCGSDDPVGFLRWLLAEVEARGFIKII